jgi:hypothetical protein
MNEQIENYNVIIERLCSEFDFELIRPDLKDAHFFDGIHLNDDGNWQVSYQLVNVVLQGRGFDSLALEVERNGNRF